MSFETICNMKRASPSSKRRWGQMVTAVVMLVWPILGAHASSHRACDFEVSWSSLVKLETNGASRGFTKEDQRHLRGIRRCYLSIPQKSVMFLTAKLAGLNAADSADKALLASQSDWTGVRYFVVDVLASSFNMVSGDLRSRIVDAIVHSYTPSSYGAEDLRTLNSALLRIGRPGVPAFAVLAESDAPPVRCSAMDVLNAIAVHSGSTRKPPSLSCKDDVTSSGTKVQEWKRWWSTHGKLITIPSVIATNQAGD